MEINGIAHVVLRASRFAECIPFYDQLMPELGLEAVHRDDDFVYYIGGRTALAIRQVDRGSPIILMSREARTWITSAFELVAAKTSMICTSC